MGPHAILGTLIWHPVFSGLLTFYLTAPISPDPGAGFGRLLHPVTSKVRLGSDWLRRRATRSEIWPPTSTMAMRLEELMMSRDRLLADISHELRSSLARLHLAIALARQSPDRALQSLERIGC